MKKIISIMLSVLFIISSTNIVFAENERYSEEKIQESLDILKILDVISDDYTKDTAANQEVTRAEFSYYAVRLIKLQDYNHSTYFYDVPDSHWAFESINALASTGVVSGYGDHLFMPDQKISSTEATTILLRLFGYSSEYFGANRFNSLAVELDLLKGFKGSSVLTLEDMLILLRNALECNLCETKMGINKSYYIGDETVLSKYYDSYFEKGVLSGASRISIYGESINDNTAIIDGVEYINNSETLIDYLGEDISFIYRENEREDTREILWFQSRNKNNDTITLGLKDDKEYDVSNNSLKYALESENRTRTVRLASNITILYNGDVYDDINKALNAENYTVKLLKTNNSNAYNLAIVEEYFNVVVSGVSSEDECIYNSINGEKISLSDNDYDKVTIIDEGGNPTEFSSIVADDCVSVYRSASNRFIRAVVSKQKITGVISSMSNSDNRKTITIDGQVYEAYTDNVDLFSVKTGETVTLFLDINGYIAKIKKSTASINAAFLLNSWVDDAGDTAWARLFTSTGDIIECEAINKLRINGNRVNGAQNVVNLLSNKQLVLYKLNKDNQLTQIDTVTANGNLKQLTSFSEGAFKWGSGRVNNKTILSRDTIVFSIPNDLTNAKKEDFAIKRFSDFVTDQNYNTASYTASDTDGAAEILVVKGKEWGTPDYNSAMILVDDVNEAVDDDEELVYQICGNRGQSRVEVMTESRDVLKNVKVEKGDLINIILNDKGTVKSVDVLYDENVTEQLTGTNLYVQTRVITAYVNEMEDNIMKIGYDSPLSYDEKWNCEGVPVLIYDSSRRKDPIQVGTTDDLRNLEVTADYSKILIQSYYAEPVQIIIYK
ncbi:S-layer homology domain-containing protein [Lachnospiraceae bacterium MD329]|nr:S-layer homology domain-containing protein [Lachnospiraceae bacterium MD329]